MLQEMKQLLFQGSLKQTANGVRSVEIFKFIIHINNGASSGNTV
jgi:hypothetical protein